MAKPQSRVERKLPEYGSDVVVDLMKAFDIEYAAFNPGATFRGIHDSIVNYGGNHRPEVISAITKKFRSLGARYAKARVSRCWPLYNMVGLQHASMAIFNAYIDRVPIWFWAAPVNEQLRRRPRIDWIHTALVQGNQVRDYVKWDDQPFTLADVPDSFIRGYCMPPRAHGPGHINYDADIQEDAVTTPVEIPDVSRHAPPAPMQANRKPSGARLSCWSALRRRSLQIPWGVIRRRCRAYRLAELAIPVGQGARSIFLEPPLM
jgi:acetolactate synthase-1/2/3 large subunit